MQWYVMTINAEVCHDYRGRGVQLRTLTIVYTIFNNSLRRIRITDGDTNCAPFSRYEPKKDSELELFIEIR